MGFSMGNVEKDDPKEGAEEKFPPCFPDDCPAIGQAINATIFHGCEYDPPNGDDFVPFACSSDANKRKRAARKGCNGWGISCWVSEDDARHTQSLFGWAARWYIFRGDVTPKDGKLAHTPSQNQEEHYTFWCFEGVSIKQRFTCVLPPNREFAK